jgi:hypothetical protein
MRRLYKELLLVVLAALPPIALAALWIKSYEGNDYIFWRWMKVTDEKGQNVDLSSRTPEQWEQHPGSKFQTRYVAVASRGGGVVFGLVLGCYVTTQEGASLVPHVLQYHRMRAHDGRAIGIGHSAWRKYPLSEDPLKFGFGYQNRLYTEPEDKSFNYREHWALVVPHWFVFTMVSLPCILYMRRLFRRMRRRARGCCEKCGYDLRATPGKCPECGGASKAASASPAAS